MSSYSLATEDLAFASGVWTPCYNFEDNAAQAYHAAMSFRELIGRGQYTFLQKLGQDNSYERFTLHLIQRLQRSGQAMTTLELAALAGYKIAFAFCEDGSYRIDSERQCVIFNHFGLTESALLASEHYSNRILQDMIRALREIWHEIRISDIYSVLNAENILKFDRFRQADREVFTALVLWQLRCDGDSKLWRDYIGSEWGDIGLAFAHLAEKSVDASSLRKALQNAFRKWFSDDLRESEADHDALNFLDDLITISENAPIFGRHVLNACQLAGLFSLPDGFRYLDGMAEKILGDPFYAGCKDPVNQAHFYQILQEITGVKAGGVTFGSSSLAAKIFPDQSRLF